MQSIKSEKTSNRVLFMVSIILVAFMLCATVLGLLFFRQAISKNKKAIAIEGEEQYDTEILRQYFINHPQSIDKYTFLQNSAFTHWVKEKCSKMC